MHILTPLRNPYFIAFSGCFPKKYPREYSNLSSTSTHTEFNDDGSITTTTSTTEKVTTFNDDGSITTVLKINDDDGILSQTITQVTAFNDDESIDTTVTTVVNTDSDEEEV